MKMHKRTESGPSLRLQETVYEVQVTDIRYI